ncbi:hypothetical protein GCM10027569_48830 [Flindersiella endophytica]
MNAQVNDEKEREVVCTTRCHNLPLPPTRGLRHRRKTETAVWAACPPPVWATDRQHPSGPRLGTPVISAPP